MAEEREKQEKLLAKLQWLTERSRIDFKGNPAPFETKKTQQSVEHDKAALTRLQASDVPFLPFNHTKVPLALDATRTDYLRGQPRNATFDETRARQAAEAAHVYGPQRQRIDPETGLTEIQRALCWGSPQLTRGRPTAEPEAECEARAPARAACPCHCHCHCPCHCQGHLDGGVVSSKASAPASSSPSQTAPWSTKRRVPTARVDPVTLGTLPIDERSRAYRDEMINYPKFTQQSAETHCTRWECGSQLSAPVVAPPRRRRAGYTTYGREADKGPGLAGAAAYHADPALRTRNPIRMRTQAQ